MANHYELEIYKNNIKEKINRLIDNYELEKAKELISQYEEIILSDIDIFQAKSIISMYEGKIDEAEKILKDAIHIDNFNSDTYYNLGYLYQLNNKFDESFKFYQLAKQYSNENEVKAEIEDKLKQLEELLPNNIKYNNLNKKSMKKVLIIAHIFPPLGGSGVQRTLKFVKFLQQNGWDPTVVTVGKSKYPLIDPDFLSEIPMGIQIIRIDEPTEITHTDMQEVVKIFDQLINSPALMKELLEESSKNNQLLSLPDGYIYWASSVIKKIEKSLNVEDYNMIYSTSGPYSDHIIGYVLKQKYLKPWVADFRDEWTNNCYSSFDHQSLSYRIQFAMEKNIVEFADKIITTTSLSTSNYCEIFNLDKEKVDTITNGFDEEDFKFLNEKSENQNEKFTIVHNGLFYSLRTPKTFLTALTNLINKGKINRDKISVLFSWSENQKRWLDYTENIGLEGIVQFNGYLSHKESLEMANSADLLLLVVGSEEKSKAMFPGKIFEYLRLCKPILALSPKDSVVDGLINVTGSGKNIEFTDVDTIEDYIYEKYVQWEQGRDSKLILNENIKLFERKELTRQLAKIFDELVQKLTTKNNKIAFFSIKGGDKFLNDIIRNSQKDNLVKKS